MRRLNEIAYERRHRRAARPSDHSPAELMARLGRRPRRAGGARPRAPRLGLQGAARPGRGGPQGGPAARGRRDQSSLELGIDMGAVDLVVQVESPPSRGLRAAAGRPGRPPGGRGVRRCGVPEVPRRPGADRRRHGADARRRDRGAAGPRQPAGRAGPADRRDGARWTTGTVDDLLALVRRAAPFASLPRVGASTAVLDMLAGPLPVATTSPSCARGWCGTASRARSPAAPARSGWPSPRGGHDPRPRAVRRVPRRRRPKKGGGRVGELDEEMVYESRVGDVFTLGTIVLADRGHHPRPGAGHPGPGVPGRLPFWKGDQLGPAAGAGPGGGRVPARGRRAARRRRPRAAARGRAGRRGPPTTCWPTSTSSARRAATCPTTGPSWSSGSATSWATGGWWCTRRSARQVHAPWALALGARLRERYGMDAQVDARRRRHRAAAARRRPDGLDLLDRRGDGRRGVDAEQAPVGAADVVFDTDEVEHRHRPGRRLGAVRLPVPRVRGPRAAAAAPQPRPAHAAVAAAAARRPAAPGGQRVRLVPDRAGSGPRVPPGRLRRARARPS